MDGASLAQISQSTKQTTLRVARHLHPAQAMSEDRPRAARWEDSALERVRTLWSGPHKGPWCHGLWVSARERFDTVPLPADFSLRVERLDGVWRRLALHPGEGRAVVVVPGLYARLTERLFADVAARMATLGRPVVLLEDRLARDTVSDAGRPEREPEALGAQLGALCEKLGDPPDVLALSAGLVSAWTLPPGRARRVVGYSGIRVPAVSVEELRRHRWVYRHFAAAHREARLETKLPFDRLLDQLSALPLLAPPDDDWLLVHAEDDPVAPITTLDSLDPARVLRLPDGGHLGFGVTCGLDIYVAPFRPPI